MGCGSSGSSKVKDEDAVKKKQDKGAVINQSLFINEKDGSVKDSYHIREKLGEGAFGLVRRIVHKTTQEERALKQINKTNMDQEDIDKLLNEITILKQLDHPMILKIFEFYQDKKNFFIVSELVKGGELFDKIIDLGGFSEEEAAKVFKELVKVINYTHSENIMHRDLKPENILLDIIDESNYSIKVIDWGTGESFKPNQKFDEVVGTPYYIAPEVLERSYESKCDIWSCGVILYIILTGEPPFGGDSDEVIMFKIKQGKFGFDSEASSQISDLGKDLIKKMLTKSPTARPSAQEVLKHPWFKIGAPDVKVEKKTASANLSNLKSFHTDGKLQQAVLTFIASQLVSKDEMENLKNMFQQLDKDGNGTLTKQELLEGYKEIMGQEDAQIEVNELFAQMDTDNSGTINYTEYITASMDKTKAVQKQKLEKAFKIFDQDGNGVITKDELLKIMGGGKVDVQTQKKNTEMVNKMVADVDVDGDGNISFDEFCTMMRKYADCKEK